MGENRCGRESGHKLCKSQTMNKIGTFNINLLKGPLSPNANPLRPLTRVFFILLFPETC